jgi:hypothetical protein
VKKLVGAKWRGKQYLSTALKSIPRVFVGVFVGAHVVLGFLSILPFLLWAWLVGWLVDAI